MSPSSWLTGRSIFGSILKTAGRAGRKIAKVGTKKIGKVARKSTRVLK